MLIAVVLFMKLADLNELMFQKILVLKNVGIYKKYSFNFQSNQNSHSFAYFVLVYTKWLIANIVKIIISLQKSVLEQ